LQINRRFPLLPLSASQPRQVRGEGQGRQQARVGRGGCQTTVERIRLGRGEAEANPHLSIYCTTALAALQGKEPRAGQGHRLCQALCLAPICGHTFSLARSLKGGRRWGYGTKKSAATTSKDPKLPCPGK